MLIRIIKIDKIKTYKTPKGKEPYLVWARTLDPQTQLRIHSYVERIAVGGARNNVKYLSDGVYEIKIDIGPGYRVYFGLEEDSMILLCGGTKSSQQRDIDQAKSYWRTYVQK